MSKTRTIYFLFDGVGAIDGEMYDNTADLFSAMNFAMADAVVAAFDPRELTSGAGTSLRNVTEDMVNEAWSEGLLGRDTKLAGAWIKFPQTAEDVADAWRDERAVA